MKLHGGKGDAYMEIMLHENKDKTRRHGKYSNKS
jgi:hypothetical protein